MGDFIAGLWTLEFERSGSCSNDGKKGGYPLRDQVYMQDLGT
jgi:hypothetical protein